MYCFFNLNLDKTLDELRVLEVINIFLIFLFFSNLSIKGMTLKISPTLEP